MGGWKAVADPGRERPVGMLLRRARRPADNVAAPTTGPQLATLRSTPPQGDYLHEIKYDGYRVQIHVDRGAKAFTRNGLNWTKRFSTIAGAFDIPGQAIIDGEVVVVHEGRTNFSELQADLAKGSHNRLLYYAFDILWLDGKDLRKTPQVERKALLKELFDPRAPTTHSIRRACRGRRPRVIRGRVPTELRGDCLQEGGCAVPSERNEAWLKVKTVQEGTFPVVGFVKDPSGIAALYLGKKEGNSLVYMGKVGTGWSRTVSSEIRKNSKRW